MCCLLSLTRGVPPAIGQMTSLKSLDMSFNKLFVLLPSIGNLKQVETINLGYNVLESLPREIGAPP
jgi:Leucine-rich repeat (LRR) protein